MGKRSNRDSYRAICDELEMKYQRVDNDNEVEFVRKYFISNKLNENYDCLLKIKADAEDCDTNSFFSLLVCVISMFFTGISFLLQVFSKMPNTLYYIIVAIDFVIVFFLLMFIIVKYFGYKNRYVVKWRKYILVIVNKFIRELEEKQYEIQKDKQKTMQKNKIRKHKNTSHQK